MERTVNILSIHRYPTLLIQTRDLSWMFNMKWLQYRPSALKNLIWSRFSKWKIKCQLSVWCWVSYVKVALHLSIDSQIRKYVNLWIFCQLGAKQMWSILSSQKNIPRRDFSGQMSVRPFARTIWICLFCVCMYALSSACIGIFELDGAPSRPLCFGEHCTVLTKPCNVPMQFLFLWLLSPRAFLV